MFEGSALRGRLSQVMLYSPISVSGPRLHTLYIQPCKLRYTFHCVNYATARCLGFWIYGCETVLSSSLLMEKCFSSGFWQACSFSQACSFLASLLLLFFLALDIRPCIKHLSVQGLPLVYHLSVVFMVFTV